MGSTQSEQGNFRQTGSLAGGNTTIDLPYSLMIEAIRESDYFSFYSPALGGFTGSGRSIEDCLTEARCGTKEYVELLVEQGLPVPPRNPDPVVSVRNEQKGAASLAYAVGSLAYAAGSLAYAAGW